MKETAEEKKKGEPRQKRRDKRKKRGRIVLFSVLAAVLLSVSLLAYFVPPALLLPALSFPPKGETELRLHFVDVGQGDCAIVEFPEGDVLVIDAGDGSFSCNNHLARYLKGLKPKTLSMLLTHPDEDHYGGFLSLLKLYDPAAFYLPVLSSDADLYQTFSERLEKEDCIVQTMTRGDTVKSPSGAYLVCLSPGAGDGEEDENDASAVLYLSYGGVSAVFCGDISSKRERKLCEEYALDETLFDSGDCKVRLAGVDVLKTAHHGSADASSASFLSLLRPGIAVISCGRGNSYSHPAGECVERLLSFGAQIYRTDERGDIIISIDSGNISVTADGR